MAEPCGCKAVIYESRRGRPPAANIIYCPMHAEAGDMLAALREIERECNGHLGWTESAPRNEIFQLLGALGTMAAKAQAAARGGVG